MISSNDLRKNQSIIYNDELWRVVDSNHVKHGRGKAIVRAKLRNMRTGAHQDVTFRAGERVERAHIENKKMQYLYEDDGMHNFMDVVTYEQIGIPKVQIEEELKFLKDNMEVEVITFENEVLGIDLPPKVNLEVTATEPGIRGDTQSGGSKPATLETGAVITVPLFINVGDTLEVNTEDGTYSSRA